MIADRKNIIPTSLVLLLTFLGVAGLIWLAFNYTTHPFLYLFVVMFIAINIVAFSTCGSRVRTVLFNVSFVFLCLAAIELYGSILIPIIGKNPENLGKKAGDSNTYDTEYFRQDREMGYGAISNASARNRKPVGNQIVYDVVYTTNAHGLRIAPHDVESAKYLTPESCVFFFGCSYAVGEGVNDYETLPWQLEKQSKGNLNVYNLGFHGYGSHQMLRMMESGYLDAKTQPCLNKKLKNIAVYQALLTHIDRSSGNYPYIIWGRSGPKYRLDRNGDVVYVGPFNSPERSRVESVLVTSYVYKKIRPALLGWKRSKADIELYVGTIAKAKKMFEEKYQGRFVVLLWNYTDKVDDQNIHEDADYGHIVNKLKELNIEFVEIDKVIPDLKVNRNKYRIPNDGHPNGVVYAKIAEFLANYFNNQSLSEGSYVD